MKKKIVIVGGGFGGVYTARYLWSAVRRGEVEITIINRTNYFLFTPLLHEVATGGLSPLSASESLREIFRHEGVKVVEGIVEKVDVVERVVSTSVGDFNFDYVVLSTGAETNFYNIPGAEENSLVLKNLADALTIRDRIITACEKASQTTDEIERQKLLSFVVVGGGPTGVELVAEIADFVKGTLCRYYRQVDLARSVRIVLLSANPELLTQAKPVVQRMAKKALEKAGVEVKTSMTVTSVTPQKIEIAGENPIETFFVVWCAGVKAITPHVKHLTLSPSGRVKTDPYLRDSGHPHVFILGDIADGAPMLAQVAVQQAKIVAHNIQRESRPKKYNVSIPATLVSLGQWSAVGTIYGLSFGGPVMWFIWRTVYLFKFISWRKRFEIALEWTVNLFTPRDITKPR